jgi:signal transduction histidine kinase
MPPYKLNYAEELLAKGDILFRLHLFNEAYAAYFDGRSVMENAADACDKSRFFSHFYRRLADISYGKGAFEESAAWQKKALTDLSACVNTGDETYLTQGTLDNIGLSYLLAGKPDSALFYFNSALKLISEMKITGKYPLHDLEVAEGVILGNRGTLFFKTGKLESAEQDFVRSIGINERKGYANEDALITRTKLGELYLKSVQISKAGEQVKNIDTDAFKNSPLLIQQQFTIFRANYADATGKIGESNRLLKQYINEADSSRKINKALFTTDFGKEFELLKKQYDLDVLNRKNEWQAYYLITSAVIGLFAIAIIYLLIRNSRQIKHNARLSAAHNIQLEATLSSLEKSNRENALLMGVVAHDLKNPISAIYGISAVMIDEEHTAENKALLELIKKSSEHLNQIVSDILYARQDNKTITSPVGKANLCALLKESVDLLQYRAAEKQQKIILNSGDDVIVSVNREAIWRVVNNLIVNAIKFSPLHTVIHVSWVLMDVMVKVSVKDQGIGIPQDLRDQLFHMDTGAKRTGTAGEETFGLGLYISRQLIEEQGGKLWLEGNSDNGSTFCFSLPIYRG